MRDLHCHILPGVDDGAADLAASLRMLEAARAVGVTSMVCTPHVNGFWCDRERDIRAYAAFRDAAAEVAPEVHVSMGFEVAHSRLMQLGVEQWAPYLRFAETPEFLLELDSACTDADFRDYERTIYALQCLGLTVIIAHPERYRAVHQNIQRARDLVDWGCELQASANFIAAGPFDRGKKTAKRLFDEGLYSFIASDAHRPEHYEQLARAVQTYGLAEAPEAPEAPQPAYRAKHFRQ